MSALKPRRRALWLVFFLNGAVLSSWAPRIPEVKEHLRLSELDLGIALLGVALGSMPTLLITGRLLRRGSARTLCRVSALVFAAGLPLIAGAVDLVTLTLALVLLGSASGMLDVAMNAAAVELERTSHTIVLPGLHGGYSLGVLGGAGLGALAAGRLPVGSHFVLVSGLLLAILAMAWRGLPPEVSTIAGADLVVAPRGRRWPAPWGLIIFALCALLVEGLITDWSAVLLKQELGASATTAGLAVTAFSAAMTLSRSAGNWLTNHLSPAQVVRGGNSLVAIALVVGLLQSSPAVLIGAFAVVGLGCGPLFPLAISAAAARAQAPVGSVTASLTAWGYLAYLGGPPLTGVLAEHIGLTEALLLVGGSAAVIMLALGILVVRWPGSSDAHQPIPVARQ